MHIYVPFYERLRLIEFCTLHCWFHVCGEILSRSAPIRDLQSDDVIADWEHNPSPESCLVTNVPLLLSSLRGWLLGKGSTVTLMFSAQWICPTVILSHLLLEDISTDSLQQSYKMSWINWQNSRPHMFTLFACLSNWIIYSSLNNIYCIDTSNRRPYYLSDRGLLQPFIDHW